MGIVNWIKGVINNMFKTSDAKKAFNVDVIMSDAMDKAVTEWNDIVMGKPEWVDKKDDIETINFAKFMASYVAKKICLDIDINVSGSARAEYMQSVIDALKKVLRDKVEDACCMGGIMMKPNGNAGAACIDYVATKDFLVTRQNSNGDILGAIFFDYYQNGDDRYVRMEYHRFEDELYVITNKAYKLSKNDSLSREVMLDAIKPWENIQPEVYLENVKKPLFAYYKMPYNNTIDSNSPLGVPVFYNATHELKDLDIAWSRKSGEVEDSKHIMYVGPSAIQYAKQKKIRLPRFMRELDRGTTSKEEQVHEHVATILTEQRIKDINSILSMISTKSGFSQGQFCLDGKTGMLTATQVESDDRETIETIKEMRDSLKDAIEDLLYAINVYADLYDYAPVGEYETSYSFGDLTYSYDEDRTRHWQYVQQGKYPLYRYYMKFEGMSEEEAKQVVLEASNENQSDEGLFG